MEMDLSYTDCIVKRWQDYTGRKAVLEGGGALFEEVSRQRLKQAA